MIDLHTHILPGLDDGPADAEEALAMCRLAVADGTAAIVASPHMFDGAFNVTRMDILDGVCRLQDVLDAEGIPLRVFPGADVHAVPELEKLVREGCVMTISDRGKYLITELPQDVLPHRLFDLLFSIQLAGVTPIISHPERNLQVQTDPFMMAEYTEAGNLVQLTAASITGDFGSAAQSCAHVLISARLAHLVASDAHSIDRRPPILSHAFDAVKELLPLEETEEMFVHSPLRILAGEYPDLYEPSRLRMNSGKKFRFWNRRGERQAV